MDAVNTKPIPNAASEAESASSGESADPLRDVQRVVDELRESVAAYARVSLDSLKSGFRSAAIKALLLLGAAALAGFTMLIGLVFALSGLADGISAGLRAPEWAGRLIVGVLAVGLPIVALRIRAGESKRIRVERLKERYANDSAE